MSQSIAQLRAFASSWLEEDPDPDTREIIRELLDDEDALIEHFGHRLDFGTAGIRGALGPGPNRMNRSLVRRVTAGLARVLTVRPLLPESEAGAHRDLRTRVVIGYDAREMSSVFARDAACVLTGAGFEVSLFPTTCPTPLLAFAVRATRAAAGIMITASHNPPKDNGYKLYGPDGAQIIPPVDRWIAEQIWSIDSLSSIPLGSEGQLIEGGEGTSSIETLYLDAISSLRVHPPQPSLNIVYTPLHGVGWDMARRALHSAGYSTLHVVPEQEQPDGRFPTVSFPNPEEPGALDLAMALAARVGADLILANDPDADRIAVAVPTPSGVWRRLDGNEVGTLLAEDLLAYGAPGPRSVATTVVSSTLLARIAAHHGARYTETLTGFKWIARAMTGPERFVLGYEEALGVCAGDVVHDKDGISAAVLVADLASHLARRGQTLLDALDALAMRHGVHRSDQLSLVRPGEEGRRAMASAMASLRATPWTEIGGRAVTSFEDLAHGRPGLPPTDLLIFRQGADRIMLRPSGTEPKLKCYVEVVEAVGDDGLDAARARCELRIRALLSSLREQLDFALSRPEMKG